MWIIFQISLLTLWTCVVCSSLLNISLFFIYFILRQSTTGRSLECHLPLQAAIRNHYNRTQVKKTQKIRLLSRAIRHNRTTPKQLRETCKPHYRNAQRRSFLVDRDQAKNVMPWSLTVGIHLEWSEYLFCSENISNGSEHNLTWSTD